MRKSRIIKSRLCACAHVKTVRQYKVKAMAAQHENEILLEDEVCTLRLPPMYKVVLLNDDFTPMEFVISVLQEYFYQDLNAATQIMLKVHQEGKGTCGVFPKDIANTKVELVLKHARKDGYPLQCMMEEA